MKVSVRKFRKRRYSAVNIAASQELLAKIWGIDTSLLGARLDSYLDHYNNLVPLAPSLQISSNQNHVIELVEIVRFKTAEPITAICDDIKQASRKWRKSPFNDHEAVQALQLATKLWLFSSPNLGQLDQSFDRVNQHYYAGNPLISSSQAGESTTGLLSADFSAKSLTRKGGFYLIWTSEISEHLTFVSKDQLRVFRHAHILLHYQRNKERTLYPDNFLEETYRTLHLLFPFEDYKTSKRVKRIACREDVDIEAAFTEKSMGEHEKFQIASYKYYGHRLAEIQRRYDLARPHRPSQWWYDRRQRPEWAALMIALVVFVLTVFFGIAQTVTGILQVVKSSNR